MCKDTRLRINADQFSMDLEQILAANTRIFPFAGEYDLLSIKIVVLKHFVFNSGVSRVCGISPSARSCEWPYDLLSSIGGVY